MKNIKLFADGADKKGIMEMYCNPRINGFTTNPTLMRKAVITDYIAFAKDILKEIPDKPISFECLLMSLKIWRGRPWRLLTGVRMFG